MWFEKARTPLFKFLHPILIPKKWELILCKIEVDYMREIDYRIVSHHQNRYTTYRQQFFFDSSGIIQNGKLRCPWTYHFGAF